MNGDSVQNGAPSRSARRSGLLWIEAAFVYAAAVLVGGTGVVYAVFRYMVSPPDEFSVANHPSQPTVQHLHVLFAPALVLAIGLLWRPHALALWVKGGRARRKSGLALMLSALPMIVSGSSIQIADEPLWREAWGVIHTAASLLWLAALVAHILGARQNGNGQGAANSSGSGPPG